MNTDDKQYKKLIRRWFNGEESEEDAYTLHTLLKDNNRLPELIAALEEEYNNLSATGYPEEQARGLAEKIAGIKLPDHESEVKGKLRFLGRWRVAAASVLLVLSVTVYFLATHKRNTGTPATAGNGTEIKPGMQGAVLTLADGSQILLDTIQNSAIAMQGGVSARVTNGVLVYEGTGNEIVYNTISTPKGRQYHLTLPDGSGIWLNAASSIRFPTSFSGPERQTEITGEVYFEIAASSGKPFSVNVSNKALVQVLGTHFNINSYENEENIAATLLEGSILASPGRNKSAADVVLRAGQQALIARMPAGNGQTGIKVVNDADIEKVMAWKNGLFNFNGASLAEVMKELERWYDIEVVYEQGIPEKRMTGKMTKDISLDGLLVGLKELGINCRLEGRKLIVLP